MEEVIEFLVWSPYNDCFYKEATFNVTCFQNMELNTMFMRFRVNATEKEIRQIVTMLDKLVKSPGVCALRNEGDEISNEGRIVPDSDSVLQTLESALLLERLSAHKDSLIKKNDSLKKQVEAMVGVGQTSQQTSVKNVIDILIKDQKDIKDLVVVAFFEVGTGVLFTSKQDESMGPGMRMAYASTVINKANTDDIFDARDTNDEC